MNYEKLEAQAVEIRHLQKKLAEARARKVNSCSGSDARRLEVECLQDLVMDSLARYFEESQRGIAARCRVGED